MSHLSQINFLKYHIKNRNDPEFQEYSKFPDVAIGLCLFVKICLYLAGDFYVWRDQPSNQVEKPENAVKKIRKEGEPIEKYETY